MAGVRWPLEDSDLPPPRVPAATAAAAAAAEMISDDDRSVAADSWSIKSEYGSTLDDEQRHVDAAEVLLGCNFPAAASDYRFTRFPFLGFCFVFSCSAMIVGLAPVASDKDGTDSNEVEASLLGLLSYWDASYAEDLANFHEHGHAGEIWFGNEVMETVAAWTKNLCANVYQSQKEDDNNNCTSDSGRTSEGLSGWSVLDIGTGNGLLLQELAKQGYCSTYQSRHGPLLVFDSIGVVVCFAIATAIASPLPLLLFRDAAADVVAIAFYITWFSNLTGTDYSEGAIVLAQNLATRNGYPNINFLVCDIVKISFAYFGMIITNGT
ncbi:hypothetical protein BHE74_00023974 [Ensete ventricosum]|nr:hypothetical protein BHE74_00023974 [Ensete ventricosum]